MLSAKCTNVVHYQPDESSFDRSKVRCRFLLTLVDDAGEPVLDPTGAPYTHGYVEPVPPPGFDGFVAPGLEYDFPHGGSDSPFKKPGVPTKTELRACIERIKKHWFGELTKPGGPLGRKSSPIAVDDFEV